ncbi:MAG TPA: hypothetical protein VFZ54_19490, partial [Burkholderiales bacterium]
MKNTFEGIAFQGLSRRAFLISSGATAVAVAFGGSLATMEKAFGQSAPFSPNGWVRVGTDNIVTVYA